MTVLEESLQESPFEGLSKELNLKSDEERLWWEKTGVMLSRVLSSASYTRDEQLQYLQFYAQALLPLLGPYPQSFRSSITRSGLPLELSINYQQQEKPLVVRIGFEPLNALSGTPKDPFNCLPASELLSSLAQLRIPGYDEQIWHQVIQDHTVSQAEQGALQGVDLEAGYIRSQTAFGFDLKREGKIAVKGYSFPALKCKVTGQSMAQLMATSIANLTPLIDCSPAFATVDAYLREVGYDDRSFFSWDFVDPARSRLKLYTGSNSVTWEKLAEVWTLGNRVQSPTVARGLEYLRQLWDRMQLAAGERDIVVAFDDQQSTSKATPLLWNYEMRAGNPTPLTKLYFPVHGESDWKVITAVADFLCHIGLERHGQGYVEKVKSYYPGVDLTTTDRFTSWVSFAYTEKTGVYLSTYYHSSTDNPWKITVEEEEQA
ncbi:putative tryptophan dimethylallyltransferase [Aspergillus fijiensis CBS 313.89]|uniref:Putative tryptophan dimethylallyltransferase n=1 Tax=Aspergillus fijiensis CBS 313.89 TaxID=1448319 RepID=A0A8G1VYS6_9EURO|nr:putative tryptophan dimethylallyltransferase [Aspergillus fijiensis CBS 313.89]RAK76606.1 putative tryptophan dimethylallyltransferase [Aspergillus fijiensis CBS 313.89]